MRTPENTKNSGSAFMLGAVMGGFLGAAIALLKAPQSGDEMQSQIRAKGIEFRQQAEGKMGEGRQLAENKYSEARESVADWLEEQGGTLNQKAKEIRSAS